MRKAIFFDQDGVLNEAVRREKPNGEVQYTAPFTLAEFKVIPGVMEVIARVRELGWLAVIVTNKPDLRNGKSPAAEFDQIMTATRQYGANAVYSCLHVREDECDCKKPKPGMLLAAARTHGIDLVRSFMVGDTATDIEAGKAAGCRTILIRTSYNQAAIEEVAADYVVGSLEEAISIIAAS